MQSSFSLQVDQLSYQLGNKLLLDKLSFKLAARQKVALLGLNGAGKSTLLKLLVASEQASQGEMIFADLKPQDNSFNKRLGFQASGMQALPNLSVSDYLELVWNLKGLQQSGEDAINLLAKEWGLELILERSMESLSQGNMQKLAIAQAFLTSPEFIILDEPTQALDPIEQQRFSENLNNLKKFQLCLFSSHYIDQAVTQADSVLMLHKGQLIAHLELNSENEKWLVSDLPLQEINIDSENIAIQLKYQKQGLALYRVEVNNEKHWHNWWLTLSQKDNQAQHLGHAKEALMPLFNLLANEKL